jgi:hypothetical protein
VTLLWTWESSVLDVGGSGVCGDKGQAKRAASAWMRAHGADSGTVRLVRLAFGAGSLTASHEPAGVTLRARKGRDGRVRWASVRAAA